MSAQRTVAAAACVVAALSTASALAGHTFAAWLLAAAALGWLAWSLVPVAVRLGGRDAAAAAVGVWLLGGAVVVASARLDGQPSSLRSLAGAAATFGWAGSPAVALPLLRGLPVLVIALALVARQRQLASRLGSADRPVTTTAVSAMTIAASVPCTWFVVTRYVERRSDGARYIGSLVPLTVWPVLLGLCLALVAWPLVRRAAVVRGWLNRAVTDRYRSAEAMAAVAAGAMLVRVGALVKVAPLRTDAGDPLYYHTQANAIANGVGFVEPLNWIASGVRIPTALHGPGYPVYLALFSRVHLNTWFDHKMASCLAGTVTVVLAMLIARRFGGLRVAVVAGALCSLHPNLWVIDGLLFPEGLYVACCAAITLVAYRWLERSRAVDIAVLGVLIGAAAMVRGEGALLTVVLVAPMVLLRRSLPWRVRLRHTALCAATFVVVIGPWAIRNASVFERFAPLSTGSDELLVYSNCDETYYGDLIGFWQFNCQQRLRDPDGDGVEDLVIEGDESVRAKYWREVGLDYARDNIERVPVVVLARIGRQWELYRPVQNADGLAPIEGRDPEWALVGLGVYYALAAACIPGVRRIRRDGVALWPLGAQFAAITVTAAYAYGTTRFRAPADMVMCLVAAVPLAGLVDRVWRWWRSPSQASRRGGMLARVVPFVPAGAVFAATLPGLYRHPGAPMEEGFMLVFPELVGRGWVANVDFLHLYGPGSLHILTGVYEVFGVSLGVQRTVGAVYAIAITLALIRLARPWGARTQAVTGGLGAIVTIAPTGLAALAWPGAVALGLWSLVVAIEGGRRHRWLATLLACLALTFRPDLVLVLAVAHAVRWRLARSEAPAYPTSRRRSIGEVAVGGVVGLLPMWVHVVQAGPSAVFRGMFIEPVFDLRGGRTLPRPPSLDRVDGALQFIAEDPAPFWPLPSLTAAQQIVLWFFAIVVVNIGFLVVAVRWWRRDRHPNAARLTVLGAASTALLSQALQRPDSAHLLWGSVIAIPMAGCWAIEWHRRRRERTADLSGWWNSRWAHSMVYLGPALVVFVLLPFFTFRSALVHARQTLGDDLGGLPPGLPVTRGDRTYLLGDIPPWLAAKEGVAELDRLAEPGERLLVGPIDLRQTAYSDVYFYYLFPELVPATPYIEMDPGLANGPDSSLADDVASADWLLLTRFWSGWIEPNGSIVFGSDRPNQVVEEQFCLVGSYENDLLRLYRKCDGGGAPGPYEGPYDPAYDFAVKSKVPVPARPDGTHPPGSPAVP